MSSVTLNQYSNMGFYNAPVSKSLLVLVGGAHAATHFPALRQFFLRLFSAHSIESLDGAVRVLGSKLVFPDTRTTIMACCIIYFFRVLERRYGSLKFASNLLLSSIFSLALEVFSEQYLSTRNFGPFFLVMPFYIPWYLQIPLTSSSQFGPVSISSKTFAYLMGAQMAFTSKDSLVATLCGLIAGLAVHTTGLRRLLLPGWLGRMTDLTFGRIISSSPPTSAGLMGATLEIQRSQQTEAIEQELLRARTRINAPVGRGRQMRLEELWGGRDQGPAAAPNPVHPSPLLVQTLTDMGFTRDRVEQVLRQTNNDLDMATNLLLQDM